jgi:two-component system sensor histidine kinase KdpD
MIRVPENLKSLLKYLDLGAPVGITALATLVCLPLYGRVNVANLALVYVLSVAVTSYRFGRAHAVLSSFLSVAALNYFFVEPRFTFLIADTQYLLTLIVMLVVGLTISGLAHALRQHAVQSEKREKRAEVMFELSRKLSRSRSKSEIGAATIESVNQICPGDAEVFLFDSSGELAVPGEPPQARELFAKSVKDALQASTRELVDPGTGTIRILFPLECARGIVGTLVVEAKDGLEDAQREILESFSNQTAGAVERALLAKESQAARLEAETERLRNSLLSSVSHDLRTPLTAIAGAASTLVNGNLAEDKRQSLAEMILEEAGRLNRLVRNLLDMSRLESGELKLNLEWNSLEELTGSAIARTESLFLSHSLSVSIDPDVPLVYVDGILLEQVLINLLENAARYSPAGSEVRVRAYVNGGFVRVEVCDQGSGVSPGDEKRVFEKFYRSDNARGLGFGLGLAICRGVMQAHGAQIWARNSVGGGAMMIFELKIEDSPEVPDE